MSDQQQLLLSIAGEPGVSSWLTAEPSYENGLILNKNDFRDAICLRYGFLIDGLPATCVCGSDMTVDHAMTFNNELNRKAALINIRPICPALSQVLTNFYRQPAKLFVGGETLLSEEGTTQGTLSRWE